MRSLTFLAILLILLGTAACTAAELHPNSHHAHEPTPTTGMADHHDGHEDHTHDNEGHNSAEPIPGAAEIRVIATEFGYQPAQISLTAGEPVNIVLVNEGTIEHELVIQELDFHAHVEAGETAIVGLTADETGEYEFGCYIAGHYEAGMVGGVSISN